MSTNIEFQIKKENNHYFKENLSKVSYRYNTNSRVQLKQKVQLRKSLINLLEILIKYFILSSLIIGTNQRKFQVNLSTINLKTNGTGNVAILSDDFFNTKKPIKVEINGREEAIQNKYYFYDAANNINNITLQFNDNLNSAYRMFSGCNNIIEIDFSEFDTTKLENMEYMFDGCLSLYSLDLSKFNISNVENINSLFSGCEKLEYINLNNIYKNINSLEYIFPLAPQNLIICSEYEEWTELFEQKSSLNCINDEEEDIEKQFKCGMNNLNIIKINKHICKACGYNFYPNFDNDNNSYINCYSSLEGYYLDENELSYKTCYNTCKICNIGGNELDNNCLECKDDFYMDEKMDSDYKNCYKEYMSDDAKFLMIKKYIFNELDIETINNGKDFSYALNDNIMVLFTSTFNQKKFKEKYNITIDFGQCEQNLKIDNNIPLEEPLYILEIIKEIDGYKIPKVEYELYYPFYNNSFTLLDLSSSCSGINVNISLRVKINETLDKYNPKSDYYNNICIEASLNGVDISLNQRKKEFMMNNMFICAENCDLIDYNQTNEKVKCSCEIKTSSPSLYLICFNNTYYYMNFKSITNIANINFLKCYKEVFSKKNLKKNYGFFIMLSIILIHIITLFIFVFKSFFTLKDDISYIFNALKSTEQKKLQIENNVQNPIMTDKKKHKKHHKKKNNLEINNNNKEQIKLEKRNSKKKNRNIVIGKLDKNNDSSIKGNRDIKEESISKDMMVKNNINSESLLEQKDFELNALEYENAFKLDKRSFTQYYISSIKNNHPIIFSFFPFKDYNPLIIKFFLFFFSYSSELTINALFYSDGALQEIYKNDGDFDFSYKLPQYLYSTIISKVIDGIIKNLALSQDKIIELKYEKDIKTLDNAYHEKLLKALKIKFTFFFIISFIMLASFGYYITCFCGIYINTQIHLISDSAFSLLDSFLLPFVIYLISGLLRIVSLRGDNPTHCCLFKIAGFLENYFC